MSLKYILEGNNFNGVNLFSQALLHCIVALHSLISHKWHVEFLYIVCKFAASAGNHKYVYSLHLRRV